MKIGTFNKKEQKQRVELTGYELAMLIDTLVNATPRGEHVAAHTNLYHQMSAAYRNLLTHRK